MKKRNNDYLMPNPTPHMFTSCVLTQKLCTHAHDTSLNPTRGPNVPLLDSLPPIRPDVARYTEVIHTVAVPHSRPLGHVDFYPNGGNNMPGCGGQSACNKLSSRYSFCKRHEGRDHGAEISGAREVQDDSIPVLNYRSSNLDKA
ncbi:unnamed protein product [Diatraea saccharalis]|uniref:Lipase domain-containing protein n=1 Tax=Diatraea saccharalis TaxID=40085 RepID=A0A9N9WDM1_9NEOP|nr:unnamed protein product [Diatraea saccharalis]